MLKGSAIAIIWLVVASSISAAEPIRGAAAIVLLDEIWEEGRNSIYPRSLAERFDPGAKNALLEQLQDSSEPYLADVLNPFLESLGVSHTRFFDVRHHGYYMMTSLFGTRDIDEPKLNQLGLQFETLEPNRVRAVLDGLPAHRAGLQRGDLILAVNGAPFRSLLDWQGTPTQHVLTVERAQIGSPESSAIFDVVVTPVRRALHRALLDAMKESVRAINCNGQSIGYVKLWSGTDNHFLITLKNVVREEFIDVDGLILDLRDGYGGAWWPYLDPFFSDRQNYFVTRTLNAEGRGEPVAAPAESNKDAFTGTMVVLINSGTRSGKEALAYQFLKTRRATLIGTTTAGAFTAGKGFFADRNAGYMLYLAVFEMSLDDQVIEGIGVAPHIRVPALLGVDAQLDRALQELGCSGGSI